jgi:tetratricopeptide (TPR) repeat protein
MKTFSWVICTALCLLLVLGTPPRARAQEYRLAELGARAKANPKEAAALRALGLAELRAGRFRDAERSLKRAADLGGRTPEALYEVATVAFAEGNYRAAQRACDAVGKSDKDAVIARVCRARTFLVWNRSERAFEELAAVLDIDSQNFDALMALGEAHRKRVSVSDAELAYQKALKADPKRAEPHLGLGRLYAAAGQHDQAAREFRTALSLDGDDPEALFELGRAVGATVEARDLLKRATDGRPGWDEAELALGQVLLHLGKKEEAKAAFERAVAANDKLAQAHVGLGRALMELGDLERSEKELRKALEIVPNSAPAVTALADLHVRQARNEEALAAYERAAGLDPRNPTAFLAAARLALRLGRDVLASAFLDRALGINPNAAAALALYGDVMRTRNQRAEARAYYQRALKGEGELDRTDVEEKLRKLPK